MKIFPSSTALYSPVNYRHVKLWSPGSLYFQGNSTIEPAWMKELGSKNILENLYKNKLLESLFTSLSGKAKKEFETIIGYTRERIRKQIIESKRRARVSEVEISKALQQWDDAYFKSEAEKYLKYVVALRIKKALESAYRTSAPEQAFINFVVAGLKAHKLHENGYALTTREGILRAVRDTILSEESKHYGWEKLKAEILA